MADTEQGDGSSKDGESFADTNNSPVKRGRGRPQGSKKLKVCVTDINLMEMVSGISNGDSTQTKRGRGRPKLKEETVQEESGDDDAGDSVQTHRGKGRPKESKKLTSDGDNPMTDHSKKRGRPKKSLSKSSTETATTDLANGGSGTPKLRRGRPKGSTKRKSESLPSGDEDESSFAKPRKRGRPKGSPNKVPRLLAEVSSDGEAEIEGSLSSPTSVRGRLRKTRGNYSGSMTQQTSNATTNTARRGRGRPRKSIQQKSGDQQNGSQIAKRGRGRPKGSLNKKHPASRLHGNVGQLQGIAAPSKGKRGRPRLQPAKMRGRPRKYPLPSPEDLKRPRVWKPLGRPRKYPRSDPPDDTSSLPRRSRGRPRKSESKKGAHLRKNMPTTPASTYNLDDDDDDDEPPKKRGRPPSATKSHNATPRKRGRPKGSLNKKKVNSETQLNNTHSHTKEVRNLPAVGVEYEGVSGEEVVEHDKDTDTAFVKQNKNFDVSNQA